MIEAHYQMNFIKIFQKKASGKDVKQDTTQRKPLTLNPKYLDNIQPAYSGSRNIEKMAQGIREKITGTEKYPDLSHKKIKEIKSILLHLEREYTFKG